MAHKYVEKIQTKTVTEYLVFVLTYKTAVLEYTFWPHNVFRFFWGLLSDISGAKMYSCWYIFLCVVCLSQVNYIGAALVITFSKKNYHQDLFREAHKKSLAVLYNRC